MLQEPGHWAVESIDTISVRAVSNVQKAANIFSTGPLKDVFPKRAFEAKVNLVSNIVDPQVGVSVTFSEILTFSYSPILELSDSLFLNSLLFFSNSPILNAHPFCSLLSSSSMFLSFPRSILSISSSSVSEENNAYSMVMVMGRVWMNKRLLLEG